VTVLQYFDWFDRLAYTNLESPGSSRSEIALEDARREMHILLPDGEILRGYFSIRRTLWQLPAFWPLLPFLYLPLIALSYAQSKNAECLLHSIELSAYRALGPPQVPANESSATPQCVLVQYRGGSQLCSSQYDVVQVLRHFRSDSVNDLCADNR
jgi:hypothetical protein